MIPGCKHGPRDLIPQPCQECARDSAAATERERRFAAAIESAVYPTAIHAESAQSLSTQTGSVSRETPGGTGAWQLLEIDAMRANLHATFNGGYRGSEARGAFHHGMDTVCNVLEAHQKGQQTNGILPNASVEPPAAVSLPSGATTAHPPYRCGAWCAHDEEIEAAQKAEQQVALAGPLTALVEKWEHEIEGSDPMAAHIIAIQERIDDLRAALALGVPVRTTNDDLTRMDTSDSSTLRSTHSPHGDK